MKKTLFIHIGWHKTATSLIQQYLSDNREELKKHDICYPVIHDQLNPGLIKHSYLFLSILNELKEPHIQKDLKVCGFDKLFELSLEEIEASNCQNVIISEEGLCQPTRGIPQLMGRYRDYFHEIKVVAYVRRQDYFLESLYAQFVKQKPERSKLPLREYLELSMVQQRGDYEMILDWWAEEFGQENILIAPFESDIIVPDPLSFFFKLMGLSSSILEESPLAEKELHVSPPREVTEYFRHLNLIDTGFFVQVLTEYLMKSEVGTTNTKYFGRADREAILQQYAHSNKAVADRYLQRGDGVLFQEPVIDFPNCPETWEGLTPDELLKYSLPISGKMSVEISRLYYENIAVKKENLYLTNVNTQLLNENQRLGNIKKTVYNFLQQGYRKMISKKN